MRFNPFYSQIRCTPIQNQESKKTMSNQTPEQLAEKEVNRFFGNRLTTEEYTLAVQIAKEIYHETKFNALAWAEWQERVSQFEQDLHTRLSQAEPPQRAALRFASLFLQQVACEAAKNIFSNPQESLIYLERGIEHAENFLTQGETAAGVREVVLILYDSISTIFHNSGQTGLEIQQLPTLGLWSWISLAKAKKRALILHNWQAHLRTAPTYPDFTAAFQDLLHTVLLKWHNPKRPHRHFNFMSTETLLAISESLYGLEQARENQRFKTVYRCLEYLDNSPILLDLNELSMKQAVLNKTLDELNSLNKLFVVQKIRRWKTQFKLHKLEQQQIRLANHSYWREQVEEVEKALVNWFMPAIHKQLPTQSSLDELSAVLLGLLLANMYKLEIRLKRY